MCYVLGFYHSVKGRVADYQYLSRPLEIKTILTCVLCMYVGDSDMLCRNQPSVRESG